METKRLKREVNKQKEMKKALKENGQGEKPKKTNGKEKGWHKVGKNSMNNKSQSKNITCKMVESLER